MGILVVLFSVVLVVVNVAYARTSAGQNYEMLRSYADHGTAPEIGENPPGDTPKSPAAPSFHAHGGADGFSISFNEIYTVYLDEDNTVTDIRSLTGRDEESAELSELIQMSLDDGKTRGRTGDYRYVISNTADGKCLVLMDCTTEIQNTHRLLITSLSIGLGVLVLLFFISLFLSRFVTRPVEETFNRQKQFISDASHELKTPLSTIAVNTDALAGEIGKNKKLGYIRSETARMGKLISQLLSLAQMDDAESPVQSIEFNLSDAMYQVILPFESMAFERKIAYTYEMADGILLRGDPDGMRQLAAILLDNAFKHTPDGGNVAVTLRHDKDRLAFEVFNSGDGISAEDLPHIFERFYRCDKSRSGNSYGLGLAIAKSIVERHKGTIRAESQEGAWARFTVTLRAA